MAAKCAVLLGLGEEIEEVQDTAYDGTYNVPYLEPVSYTHRDVYKRQALPRISAERNWNSHHPGEQTWYAVWREGGL